MAGCGTDINMGEVGITYSLKFNSRALVAQPADRINSKWVVGTNALREDNEIRVLQYDPDQERLLSVRSFLHSPEIWCIAPSATSEDLFLTVWSKAGSYGVSLWRAQANGSLHQEAQLEGHTSKIHSVLWHTQQPELAVTVEDAAIHTWSVSNQGVKSTGQAAAGDLTQLWGAALHPSSPSIAATAGGQNVQLWDLRSMTMTAQTQGAHRMPTRDVSFAAHNEHRLVSSGDDCKLRFWDTRMLGKGEALLELGGHSHWVWRAQYNPFYDQLIASSSSDSLVNLYHTPQLAGSDAARSDAAGGSGGGAGPGAATATRSAAHTRAGDVDGKAHTFDERDNIRLHIQAGDVDGKAHTFDEHEDSVYGLAWSTVDPWLFASLSYDGRVVMNKVPKHIKYKILI